MCVYVGFVALSKGALGGGYGGDVLEDSTDGFGGVCIEGSRSMRVSVAPAEEICVGGSCESYGWAAGCRFCVVVLE